MQTLCFICFVFSSMTVLHIILFFFNDTATTEIYTLSLHDALPICVRTSKLARGRASRTTLARRRPYASSIAVFWVWGSCWRIDRKSTRLNSSHLVISYAVFCLKKKKQRLV